MQVKAYKNIRFLQAGISSACEICRRYNHLRAKIYSVNKKKIPHLTVLPPSPVARRHTAATAPSHLMNHYHSCRSSEPPPQPLLPPPTPLLVVETLAKTIPPRSCRHCPLLLIRAAADATRRSRRWRRPYPRRSSSKPPPTLLLWLEPPMRDVERVRDREEGEGNEWWRG